MDAALMRAAATGHAAEVRRLLAAGAAPDLHDERGWSALGYAALAGHTSAIQELLAADASPAQTVVSELLPIHAAAAKGRLEAVRLLLEAAPATAAAPARGGWTPLSFACAQGRLEMARLLLAAAPEAATVAAEHGDLPIHVAARDSTNGDMIRLLLAAALQTAAVCSASGLTPLHCAAGAGNVAAVRALLAAAPEVALVRDESGCLPLETAVVSLRDAAHIVGTQYEDTSDYVRSCCEAALCLIEATPPADCLAIATHPPLCHECLPLFPHIVACHALTEAEWQLVPSPCPGLAAVLPAVFRRSAAEAALLVAHLSPADSACLRTLALCLNRRQHELRIYLPGPLVGRILSLIDAN